MGNSVRVGLLDFKIQYAGIKDEVLAEVNEVLDSQQCIGGPKVTALEEQIAALSGCEYGIGVSSGTDAMLCSLMSLDIGIGDEVITTPFTFFATAGCIARVGAKPVFVDIDPATFNIDAGKIEASITNNTKAILPVHLFGQMADMDAVMAIANKHGLAVIEDAAQAISSQYKGHKAGSIGTVGCFSFYPTKNLGGAGDGGMIVTNDKELADRMRIMRDHGQKPAYHYRFIGGNFRLDAIQAAVLLVKLRYLDGWSQKRRDNAAYYDKAFAGTTVKTPVVNADCVSIYNQYTIRVEQRDELAAYLREQNVGCGVYYPVSLHVQECFSELGYSKDDFPEAQRACSEVLSLPIYPELTEEMLARVVEAVLEFGL